MAEHFKTETQFFTFAESPNELTLVSGKKLGPITVAYEAYGELNEAKDNAVLICHGLTGDAHAAGEHAETDELGWWDPLIGPGKAIDTEKYFVVCANVLGGCKGTTGPSSINPKTNKPYGTDFPVFEIRDTVDIQKKLLDHLGVKGLHGVVGGSMGGMQVLEWTTRYPEFVKIAIPIATTSKLSPQSIAFDEVGRNAIRSDRAWKDGEYYETGEVPKKGLSVARMIGHITYLSEESMNEKFGRRLQEKDEFAYHLATEFAVESYLQHQGDKFVERFDANSYLYLTRAMDYFNWQGDQGGLKEGLKDIQAKICIVSFSSDWLFPAHQSREIVRALIAQQKEVSYTNIETTFGHDSFLLEFDHLTKIIRGALSHPKAWK